MQDLRKEMFYYIARVCQGYLSHESYRITVIDPAMFPSNPDHILNKPILIHLVFPLH